MKKYLALAVLVLFLCGCEVVEMAMGWHNPFVGKWMKKDGSGLTVKLRKDYVYEVDLEGDGTKDIWGTYRLPFQDEIIFKDEGGKVGIDCHQDGMYSFKFSHGDLRFYLVGDECSARREAMSTAWHRKVTK